MNTNRKQANDTTCIGCSNVDNDGADGVDSTPDDEAFTELGFEVGEGLDDGGVAGVATSDDVRCSTIDTSLLAIIIVTVVVVVVVFDAGGIFLTNIFVVEKTVAP